MAFCRTDACYLASPYTRLSPTAAETTAAITSLNLGAAAINSHNYTQWKTLNATVPDLQRRQLLLSCFRIASCKHNLKTLFCSYSAISAPSSTPSRLVPSSITSHFCSSVPIHSSIPSCKHLQSLFCFDSGRNFLSALLRSPCTKAWHPRSSNYSFLLNSESSSSQKPGTKLGGRPSSWVCRSSTLTEADTGAEASEAGVSKSGGGEGGEGGGGGGGGAGGSGAMGWISTATVFAFWAGFLLYATLWSPNQTPYRDLYFIEKLSGLKGNDGFLMNPVLVSVWLFMGMWGVIYSMLLLPAGRSERTRIPVWPFVTASFFFGAFALLPYFGLWQPPPPRVNKEELTRWPLNVLESKIPTVILLISGFLIAGNSFFASGEKWVEYYQYFRESRFIHVMTIDFVTLSSLAPFWIYNDVSFRIGLKKGFWFIPLSIFPILGPVLYLLLRPPVPSVNKEKA